MTRRTPDPIKMPTDTFDWCLWNLTCFPFSGWQEQVSDAVVAGGFPLVGPSADEIAWRSP